MKTDNYPAEDRSRHAQTSLDTYRQLVARSKNATSEPTPISFFKGKIITQNLTISN